MFTSTPPICTGRALELSRKDSNIRYLRHLGNSDIAILKTAWARAPAHQARGRGRRTWRPTERSAGARMVPPGEGNEARGDGRRGVGVSHSTAEAGELSPRDPVEGRGHRQVAPVEGKTANTPRLGPVSTSRQPDSRTGQTRLRDGGGHRLASWTSGYATARSEAVCRGAGCGREQPTRLQSSWCKSSRVNCPSRTRSDATSRNG